MQHGDYNPYYQFPQIPNPNPNPNPSPLDSLPAQFASAPPFSSSDYPPFPSNYPPYPQNPDPTVPSNPNFNSLSPPFDSHHVPFQNQPHPPQYPPYDQPLQSPPTYSSPPNPNPASSFYPHSASSVNPNYDHLYDNCVKFNYGGDFGDDKYGGFNRGGADLYGKRPEVRRDEFGDDGYGDGVYAYRGGDSEPYGARGTAPKSSTWGGFDDYGRSISFPASAATKESGFSNSNKVVKAVPKVDAQEDVKGGGVQKFRVKILAESGGQTTLDVLCQIGLDGIRMLDPNSGRTLRIYPLENITRCDKFDSTTLAFWSKSPVDIEPRRIRLQSNSYTNNTLLDTITAATIQFKEMGGSRRPVELLLKNNEQPTEKKKGIVDWMNIIKPANEEKDHWVPDEAVSKCTACGTDFGAFCRRHHCRNCGEIFCDKCTHGRIALTADENAQPVRVCDRCLAEVTQRLSNAKEAANKPVSQSHEDLARKLQEELERNRRTSGSKSDGSGRRMKEVECPTCTVHLQVQVPSSGSETIECGVCQHPFLVSAH